MDYDIVIIGGGPSGYVAAIRAAQNGHSVALIEKGSTLGGTCLNVGCIPSKALLHSSELFATIQQHGDKHGIIADGVRCDLSAMMARKDRIVASLTGGVAGLMKKNKVTVITGHAKLTGANQITVGGGSQRDISAQHIVIATGSKPVELAACPFDGVGVISSTEALALSAIPSSMLVVGAGAIGLELGSVWSRLGTKVTICEMLPEVLGNMDKKLAASLRKTLEQSGVEFMLSAGIEGVKQTSSGHVAHIKKGNTEVNLEVDVVLVAVGRAPMTGGLNLKQVGVATTERGFISVNERFQTTVPSIYAIGDVIGGAMLAHKAEEEGVAVVDGIAGKYAHVNYATVPNVVYTWPEVASVGMTESELASAGRKFTVGAFQFSANGRSLASGTKVGSVKIIADATNDRVLGAHIIGPHASELIAEIVTVMEFEGTSEDIARTIHAHPTLSEVVKEAALATYSKALHA